MSRGEEMRPELAAQKVVHAGQAADSSLASGRTRAHLGNKLSAHATERKSPAGSSREEGRVEKTSSPFLPRPPPNALPLSGSARETPRRRCPARISTWVATRRARSLAGIASKLRCAALACLPQSAQPPFTRPSPSARPPIARPATPTRILSTT